MPDQITHYTAAEIAHVRTENPAHFVIERITQNAVCLVLIPDTEANRERLAAHFPWPAPELIDGLSFRYDPPQTFSPEKKT